MKQYLCENIGEAVAEVEACKTRVAECQQQTPFNHKQFGLAKSALRNAEWELRAWQNGIVPPLAEVAMGAAAGV